MRIVNFDLPKPDVKYDGMISWVNSSHGAFRWKWDVPDMKPRMHELFANYASVRNLFRMRMRSMDTSK